ncbi:MAG TPA: polysaccharide deacetylase family protein, partial [Patescibacteria group bacterium]
EAKAQNHASLTVDSNIFDSQMNYLVTSGYHTISSDQVVNALINHQTLPPKSIVVTVDDGYDDAYNYAFPIAKKYNVTLDLMIPSGLINNPGYMNWSQLKEMAGNSLIHVYNHTWSHAALGIADRTKIEFEVSTSQSQLQSELGKSINILTYPYGSFSPLAISILKEHGFIAGISTINGTTQCDSYIMTLHRTHIGNAPLSSYGF